MSTTIIRNKGLTNMSSNFQVKIQGALDPRVAVTYKTELISKETWPYDGNTIYLYDGLLVSVKEEKAIYLLLDKSKALDTDYSGWHKIGSGGGSGSSIEVVDNLTSTDVDKALSANQGRILISEIRTVEAKISSIYSFKGVKETIESLPTTAANGDVWMVNGVSYVWNGSTWVALTNFIDLSSYYTKEEVALLIQDESNRAKEAEKGLANTIENQNNQIVEIRNANTNNTKNISNLESSVQTINTTLTEIQNDINDLKENGGGGGTIDPEITEKVNTNTQDITTLKAQQSINSDKLNTLTGNSTVEGSVDYKINKAFKWTIIT